MCVLNPSGVNFSKRLVSFSYVRQSAMLFALSNVSAII
jgi:hypothetical protein